MQFKSKSSLIFQKFFEKKHSPYYLSMKSEVITMHNPNEMR